MQTNKLGQAHIIEWFKERGISNEVLSSSGVEWDGKQIVIPVFDKNGTRLFNKYRRDPFLDDKETTCPKYKYDKGSEATLFNTQKEIQSMVFITEGELDTLRLESAGYPAVSSTGGSGTFDPSWVPFFKDLEVFILYDRDPSGFKGAALVQSLIPHARVITLPKFDGKDVTDYLMQHTTDDLLKLPAEQFNIPQELDNVPQDKAEARKKAQEYKKAVDELLLKKREYLKTRTDPTHLVWLVSYLMDHYEVYKAMSKVVKRGPVSSDGSDRIEAAKAIPITEYMRFNKAGYAPCLFHAEKTASMYYNKPTKKYPNTVKCFGCSKMGSVIDVVMKMQNLNFNDAVKFILNEQST